MAQRIVRAKRKLRDNHAPYRVPRARRAPRPPARRARRRSYLIFTEGHTATSGDDARPRRPLARGDPPRPRARRAHARRARGGRPARADAAHRGPPAGPHRARRLDGPPRRPGPHAVGPRPHRRGPRARAACLRRNQPGPFQIQAAIAAVHADAADRRRHRLVADRRPLRPALRAAPERGRRRSTGPSPSPSCDGAAAGLAALEPLDADAARRLPAVPRRPRRPPRPRRPARRRRSPPTTAPSSSPTNPTERRFLERQRTAAAERPLPR